MRPSMILRLLFWFTLVATFATPAIEAQSDRHRPPPILPHPIELPRIVPPFGQVRGSTSVDARLDGSILQVGCEQTFVNDGPRLEQVEILLPVPADAVVTDGLLFADGQEISAEVLPAAEARRIYEEIVRSRRDPALIELVGHGLIRLSAFPIPPGGSRTVSFRYHATVSGTDGRTRLLFPVAALCGLNRVGPLDLDLAIDGRDPLVQVYSPSHDIEIDRDGRTSAHIRFQSDQPGAHETLEIIAVRDAESIGVDLRTARGRGEDDYFLLAVSPGWDLLKGRHETPETIIFVLDTSGSMEGEKFEQARIALRRMLDDLSPDDRFNLIGFSSDVRTLFPEGPRRATESARRQAQRWVDALQATGGTAIADALDEAIRQAGDGGRDEGNSTVLFLTDGRPTVGVKDPEEILRRAGHHRTDVRIYAFGVGYDVDAHLLDDLARQAGGSVSYVRPGEDVAEAVTTLRRRVEHPCARNVQLTVTGARIHDLFPEGPSDLFAGEPLLFAGRVKPGAGSATIRLTAEGPDGRIHRGTWRIEFDDPEARSSSVPVLWASRKAASLLERIRREGNDKRALAELTELSRRYGILNEEVAMLAREPEPPLLAQRDIVLRPPTPDAPMQLRIQGKGSSEATARAAVDLSAKAWSLKEARAEADLLQKGEESRTVKTAGEVTFRLEGEIWIDTRITDPLPKGTIKIRICAFGSAYFDLAHAGGKLAEWLAVGERVRVLLPGILLEVGSEGEDTLPPETLDRIRRAAENA